MKLAMFYEEYKIMPNKENQISSIKLLYVIIQLSNKITVHLEHYDTIRAWTTKNFAKERNWNYHPF